MQYQVFKEETGELVAWIDPDTNEAVLKKGYSIKSGDTLTCIETSEVSVGYFEKVSDEEYAKGCVDEDVITTIPNLGVVGSDTYYEQIVLPKRSTKGSAGYDFFIPYDLTIPAGKTVKIPTGIKCKMAEGFVLLMYPRSGLGFKYNLTMDNTVCVIDSDYYNNVSNEGHIFVKMANHSDKDCFIKARTAYCQGIFQRYYVTDNDVAEDVRVGGYGSTTKQ